MMKQKISAFLLTGAILGSTFMSAGLPAYAGEDMDAEMMALAQTADIVSEEGFEEYIKTLPNVSEAEKDALIQTENKLAPTWEEIQKLEDEVKKIFDETVGDAKYDEYENIFGKNEALWNKFYEGIGDETDGNVSVIEEIEKANFLTASEKAILKNEQAELEALDKEVDALNDQAEAKAQPLYEQLDKLYAIVDQENSKNAGIWDKLLEENPPIACDAE